MATALGDYLRARRAQLSPESLGLPTTGVRRVPGLRREEVALLAGVSVDYYVRLEQGRERHPSAQVLDAIAAVLQPDGGPDGISHIYRIAGLDPGSSSRAVEKLDPSLLLLMSGWVDHPAIAFSQCYDVLGVNELGRALLGVDAGDNLVENIFLEPEARFLYLDWEVVAANAVAGFRLQHGRAPDHPRIVEITSRLLGSSTEFATLWAKHDVRGKHMEVKRLRHREVGEVIVTMQSFGVRAAPGQELVVYDTEPGSPSSNALRLLGSLAATENASL